MRSSQDQGDFYSHLNKHHPNESNVNQMEDGEILDDLDERYLEKSNRGFNQFANQNNPESQH
jgi:hypothetical protein